MRKQDDSVTFGGVTQRRVEVLTVGPEVTDAADSQPGAASFEPDPVLFKSGSLCVGQGRTRIRLIGMVVVIGMVIVVASYGEPAKRRLKLAELIDPGRDVGMVTMNIIAGQKRNVWFEGVGHRHDMPDIGKWDKWTMMHVCQQGDASSH